MYGFETGASIKPFHAYTSHSTQNDQNVLLHYKVRLALSAAPCPLYFIKLLPRTLQTPVNPHSIICRRASERTLTIPPHNHCPGVPALFTAYRNEHYIEYLHFLALHLPDRWLHRFQLDFSWFLCYSMSQFYYGAARALLCWLLFLLREGFYVAHQKS